MTKSSITKAKEPAGRSCWDDPENLPVMLLKLGLRSAVGIDGAFWTKHTGRSEEDRAKAMATLVRNGLVSYEDRVALIHHMVRLHTNPKTFPVSLLQSLLSAEYGIAGVQDRNGLDALMLMAEYMKSDIPVEVVCLLSLHGASTFPANVPRHAMSDAAVERWCKAIGAVLDRHGIKTQTQMNAWEMGDDAFVMVR